MSYTRRMGNFGKQQNTPLSNVGQRRQPGNFGGPGGQLMNKSYPQPGFQNKQQPQNQQQQQPQFQPQIQHEKPKPAPQQGPQNQVKGPPSTPIQKPPQQAPVVKTPQQPPVVKPTQQPPPVIQQTTVMQQTTVVQQPPVIQQPPAMQQLPAVQQPPVMQPPANMQQVAEQLVTEHSLAPEIKIPVDTIPGLGTDEGENATPQKNKPFWMKRNGRVNKAERAKRRNVRLRKLLQPKNALMIINELIGHVPFELSEAKSGFEDVYKATVTVEGSEHSGFGKSKALAKTAAAEAAVRGMILNKLKITAAPPQVPEEEPKEEVKMEVNEESQENQEDVSWTHIASFAIHKLFSSWGDDGNMADMMTRTNSVASLNDSAKDGSFPALQTQPEQKPAKKLPDTAATMNPIMLLNQMHPSAKYEELGKSGTPPHVQFTIKCTVGTQSFIGTGQNKKAARKQAALEACKTLLGIQYPPDILDGTATGKTTEMDTS